MRTQEHAVVASCQSQGTYALKHTLLCSQVFSKQDHGLQNEQHAALKIT